MKSKKLGLLILVLFLAVGFAAVTTNLILNGNTKIGMANFDVYYSMAEANNPDDYIEISADRHTLNFNTRVLSMAEEDYSVFYYEITNDSYEYDAEVEFTLNISASFDYSEYIATVLLYRQDGEIYEVNTGTTITIPAQETVEGMISVQLVKPVTEDATIDFGLDINPLPKSRLSAIPMPATPYAPYQDLEPGLYDTSLSMTKSWDDLLDDQIIYVNNGVLSSNLNYDSTNEIVLDDIGHKDGDTHVISSISKISSSLNEILGTKIYIYPFDNDYYDFFVDHNSSCSSLNGILVVDESVYKTLDYHFVCPGLKGVVFKKANKYTYDDNYLGFANIKLFNIPIENVVSSKEPNRQYYVTANKFIDGDFVYNDLSKTSIAAYIGTSRNIVMPEGVNDIGPSAFATDRIDSISFPSTYKEIEEYDFFATFFDDLVIPSTIETITRYGLSDARYNSLTLSEGLKTIGDSAFSNLDNLTVPDSVENIDDNAFSNVENLFITRNEYPRDQWGARYINPYTQGDYLLGNIGNIILYKYTGNDTSITIPDGVNIINSYVFEGNKDLINVVLPSTVKEIGYEAFDRCSNLENLIVPDGIEKIGKYAFGSVINVLSNSELIDDSNKYGASYINKYALNKIVYTDNTLKEIYGYVGPGGDITIPDGVERLCSNAFFYDNITSISLPNTLKYLDSFSLAGNPFDSIILPDGLLEIDQQAFYKSNLSSLTIPNSVTTIGSGIVRVPNNHYMRVYLPDTLPNDISSSAFEDVYVIYNGNGTIPYGKWSARAINPYTEDGFIYIDNTKESLSGYMYEITGDTLTIPDGVKNILTKAFSGRNTIRKIVMPDTVINIYESAFNGCTMLEEIKLSQNLRTIDSYAFSGHNLKEVHLPSSLRSMYEAFRSKTYTKFYFPEGARWSYRDGSMTGQSTSIDSSILFDPDAIGEWLTHSKANQWFEGTS